MSREITYWSVQYQERDVEGVLVHGDMHNSYSSATEAAKSFFQNKPLGVLAVWVEKVTQRTVGGVLK